MNLCAPGQLSWARARDAGPSDTILLDVEDHAPDEAPYVATHRPAGHGGLGLQIAQRLAFDVGWYTDGSAKHVWAILPAPA